MKLTKRLIVPGVMVLIVAITSVMLFAYPSGMTGRTLKTTTQGCSNCHTYNTAVTGLIAGPDTVIAGQTVQYSITISDPNRSHAGMDIAVRLGTLAPGPSSTYLKLVGDELTHQSSLSMTNHTINLQFNYTAPSAAGTDTVFATVTSGTPAWNWAPSKRVVVVNVLGIKNNNSTAKEYELNQNYPNPFNPATNISFHLPKDSYVKLTVYDLLGNETAVLVNGKLTAGDYQESWNASGYASGVYFYKLETEGFTATRKMILNK